MEPIDPFMKVSIKAKTLAKYHMVITYLETKENYKPEMTEDDFISNCLAFLGRVELPDYFKNYLKVVYKFHVADINVDIVYEKTDGRAFTELANELIKRIEPGMNEIEFENHLIPGYPAGGGDLKKKPKWVNWLRKFFDWLDDNWPEKEK